MSWVIHELKAAAIAAELYLQITGNVTLRVTVN